MLNLIVFFYTLVFASVEHEQKNLVKSFMEIDFSSPSHCSVVELLDQTQLKFFAIYLMRLNFTISSYHIPMHTHVLGDYCIKYEDINNYLSTIFCGLMEKTLKVVMNQKSLELLVVDKQCYEVDFVDYNTNRIEGKMSFKEFYESRGRIQ